MIKATASITIDKPVSEVFSFLVKGENNKRWRKDVTEIKLISGNAHGVGAHYLQRMNGPFGKQIEGDYKITEYVVNNVLGFV
ncbi:MAG: SRPBCC family protein, partial [Candidatus Levyibacteriota bacterium]